jgi:hypothetical protein
VFPNIQCIRLNIPTNQCYIKVVTDWHHNCSKEGLQGVHGVHLEIYTHVRLFLSYIPCFLNVEKLVILYRPINVNPRGGGLGICGAFDWFLFPILGNLIDTVSWGWGYLNWLPFCILRKSLCWGLGQTNFTTNMCAQQWGTEYYTDHLHCFLCKCYSSWFITQQDHKQK